MAFNYESPHTRYYENDLTELIRLYKQLLAEYDEILETANQLQKELEDLPTTVQTLVDEATAQLQTQIEQELADLRAEVNSTVEQLRADNDALEKRINRNIAELSGQVNQFYREINSSIQLVDSESVARDTNLQNQIDTLRFTLPDIYNPVAGVDTSIEQAILDLYGLLASDPVTASEYDAKQLTASAYDAKNITAFDYDMKASILL